VDASRVTFIDAFMGDFTFSSEYSFSTGILDYQLVSKVKDMIIS